MVLSSPGLYKRDHERCHQNKSNDNGERFKVSHSADPCQASHPPNVNSSGGLTRATIRIGGRNDAPSKITFGEMHAGGVRGVPVYYRDHNASAAHRPVKR
jgi:hypothetical protein